MATVIPRIDVGDNYKEKYGFFDPEKFVFKAKRGLSPEVVKEISWMKNEPEWMTKFRLRALQIWDKKELPTWGADLSSIDFQNIYYYLKSTEKQGKTWGTCRPTSRTPSTASACPRRSGSSSPAWRRSTNQRLSITPCTRNWSRRA